MDARMTVLEIELVAAKENFRALDEAAERDDYYYPARCRARDAQWSAQLALTRAKNEAHLAARR